MLPSHNIKKISEKGHLFRSLLHAAIQTNPFVATVEDGNGQKLSYFKLFLHIYVLGSIFSRRMEEKNIAIMLPNTVTTLVTFFAIQYLSKVPVMINYSSGPKNVNLACKISEVTTMITSKKFIEHANLNELVGMLDPQVEVIYLEDLKKEITPLNKLASIFCFLNPTKHIQSSKSCDTAVILFTSGSEGAPKGVVLSHSNLLTNCAQVKYVIRFAKEDKFFVCLPLFHSFGLGVGMLLPVFSGIKCFFYHTPLAYKVIPELINQTQSTIFFGTDTFLSQYAKNAEENHMRSLRIVIAGAEKLKKQTHDLWKKKFNLYIFEGYGVTEASPAIAVNTPNDCLKNSVGKFLPGVEYNIESVSGIKKGGRLKVKGDNIMKGYLTLEHLGRLKAPTDGWHNTGDIVDINKNGFLFILGREKRFAKIAGEMISLTQVELLVEKYSPEYKHAVCSINDESRGEKLVLVTESQNIAEADFREFFGKSGFSQLYIPKEIIHTPNLPVMANGKIDYPSVMSLIKQKGFN
ncbi:MAG: AMP-binding protein [Pseudomonadota bacterium]